MKSKLLFTAIILNIFVIAFSAYMLLSGIEKYRTADRVHTELETHVHLHEPDDYVTASGPNQDEAAERYTVDDGIQWPQIDFDALLAANPDTVGWLYSVDTPINYPIVQGQDNEYYLTHLFDGTQNASGCLFLNAGNEADFTNTHSIIFGHHMKSGSMFSSITRYRAQDYYEAHPQLLLMTPGGDYILRPFSGYDTDVDSDSWQLLFDDYANWLQGIKSRSAFTADVTPADSDPTITLSTCSYEFENARFVLHCMMTARK